MDKLNERRYLTAFRGFVGGLLADGYTWKDRENNLLVNRYGHEINAWVEFEIQARSMLIEVEEMKNAPCSE